MKLARRILTSQLLVVVALASWTTSASAAENKANQSAKDVCNELLTDATAERPQLSAWSDLADKIADDLKGEENPFSGTEGDADRTGLVQKKLREKFPQYDKLTKALDKQIPLKDYVKLREQTVAQIDASLQKRSLSVTEKFALLESVRMISAIEARVDFPLPSKEDQEKQEQKEKEKAEKEKKDKQDQEEEDDDSSPWQDKQDEFKPDNFDMESGGGKKKPKVMVKTSVASTKRLMPSQFFDVVTANKMTAAPLIRPKQTISRQESQDVLKVYTFGEKKLDLFVPYGHAPKLGKYSGFSVTEDRPGEYQLTVDAALKEVSIPLRKLGSASFQNSIGSNGYKQKTGISLKQWPQKLQEFIKSVKASRGTDMDVAAAVEQFLAVDGGYLYFIKGPKLDEQALQKLKAEKARLEASGVPTPVALAQIGAFQCSGAAHIAVSILRDEFGIPARAVGGRTLSTKRVNDSDGSFFFINANDPAHMWIEVWSGSQWVPFDPTPHANQPSESSEDGDGDSDQNDQPKPEDEKDSKDGKDGKELKKDQKQQQGGQGSGKSENKNSADENDDGQTGEEGQALDKDGKDGKKQTDGDKDAENKDAKSKDGKDGSEGGDGQQEHDPSQDQIVDKFDPKRIGPWLQTILRGQSLFHQIARSAVTTAVEKTLDQGRQPETLNALQSVWKQLNDIHPELANALKIFIESEIPRLVGPAAEITNQIRRQIATRAFQDSWTQLRSLEHTLEILANLRPLSQSEQRYWQTLQIMKREYHQIRDKDSADYEIADRLNRLLPGNISRSVIKDTYGQDVFDVGSRNAKKLANDLENGTLQSFVRMSLLKKFADVVLNGERVPSYREMPVFMRSIEPKSEEDVVLARSIFEFPKMILQPEPGEPLFAKTFQGRQFAIGPRETVQVPNPVLPVERKFSVVYYDVSGSMGGEKAKVQQTLLMNFADLTMSETDPFGRPYHEIVLIPFGDTPYPNEAVHITNREEALEFIRKMSKKPTRADTGTNITAALEHFYKLVKTSYEKKAQSKVEQRFKVANLVLFTDGEDTVEASTIEKIRSEIPANVKVNMNFVGIGGDNEDLIKLAKDSNSKSIKPMGKNITGEQVAEIGGITKLKRDQEAVTIAKNTEIPGSFMRALDSLQTSSPSTFTSYDSREMFRLHTSITLMPESQRNLKKDGATLNVNIQALRMVVDKDFPALLRYPTVLNILKNFKGASGRSLRELYQYEHQYLDSVVRAAHQNGK